MHVFGEQQSGKHKYDHHILEQNIEEVLKKVGATRETAIYDDREDCCKTFVVAKRHLALDSAAVLFKSYEVDGTEIPCTILEAARATSAAPTFFPAMKIDSNLFVDGGIGYNNPSEEAIREAWRIWPERQIGCLVSIGTGLMQPISGATRTKEQLGPLVGRVFQKIMPLTAEKLSVAEYCTQLATSCQVIHTHVVENASIEKQPQQRARYYRFNVTSGMAHIGLEEANKMNEISQMTDAYLRDPERKELISDCVELLHCDDAIKAVIG
jgi:predicted acylesterase/phospholipase RssA